MTEAAGFDFLAQESRREIAVRIARTLIVAPDDALALVKTHEQSQGRVLLLPERPPAVAAARPGDVL